MTLIFRPAFVPFLTLCSIWGLAADEPVVEIENAVAAEAQESELDPFAPEEPFSSNVGAARGDNSKKKTVSARFRFEVFEVPVLASLTMLDEEKDPTKIRELILHLVKKKEAAILSLHALRGEIGTSFRSESIAETIYPTEYQPPESIPLESPLNSPEEELNATQRQQKVAMSFASPSAFETRQLGVSLEAEIGVVDVEKGLWDVAFSYTDALHEKDKSWVEGTVKMPVFKVDAIHSFSRVQNGHWNLWSVTPMVDAKGNSRADAVRVIFVKVERLR